MAYVDLNPIRAGIATTPEDSEHTSINTRLLGTKRSRELKERIRESVGNGELNHLKLPIRPLALFADETNNDEGLPIQRDDYLALVDLTGRIEVKGKRGRIDNKLEPILDRLGINGDWPIPASGLKGHLRQQAIRQKRR